VPAASRAGITTDSAGQRGVLDSMAARLKQNERFVDSTVVDALDEVSVNRFVDNVANSEGRVDISFNLISLGDVQQPLFDISIDDFLQPIMTAMRSHFLTTRAAARHMKRQGSGVVLIFGGGGPQTMPGLGGFKIALDALEGLRRQWACELGEFGIRVVTIKTGGVPESIDPGFPAREAITESIEQASLLKRAATLQDVGEVAAFVASDNARTITSSEVNISCGSIVD
jgi:3-oxoacyl-[acyl-carrier protein] reductase